MPSPELFRDGKEDKETVLPRCEYSSDAPADVAIRYVSGSRINFPIVADPLSSERTQSERSTGFEPLLYSSRNSASGRPCCGLGSASISVIRISRNETGDSSKNKNSS